MITQSTRHRLVVLYRFVGWSSALWLLTQILVVLSLRGRPEALRTWLLVVNLYLTGALCAVWLLATAIVINWGHSIKTVLILTGLALLLLALFTNPGWLWPTGCLLIGALLFVEIFPHLRKVFAAVRESYRKISKDQRDMR